MDDKKDKNYQNSSVINLDSLFVSKSGEFLILKLGRNSILLKTKTILSLIHNKEEESKEGA